jgi:outer membrane lipoprotein-sorting protein
MLMQAKRNIHTFIFIVVVVFLIFGKPSYSQENDFEQLRQESSQIKTLQADFVQNKSMKILSKPLVSEGRFYYAAPDSFRWEYFKPLRSIVITHKNTTKRYIYSDGKFIEDKTGGAQAMKIVLSEVSGWMNGRFDQNPAFKAVLNKKTDTSITLTPVDKTMGGMIEKIEITLYPKGGTVKSVKIYEGADNFTKINFSNVKINQAIHASVFQDI